jgi:hypothetical protein
VVSETKGVYMTQQVEREASFEELAAEWQNVEAAIEAAALEGDEVGFVHALMRRSALPTLMREARLRPYKERVAALDQEMRELDRQVAEVLEGPLPARYDEQTGEMAPEHVREQARQAKADALRSRVSGLLAARGEALRQLREVENAPLVM